VISDITRKIREVGLLAPAAVRRDRGLPALEDRRRAEREGDLQKITTTDKKEVNYDNFSKE
jgi:hypothetical protein